MSCEICGDGTNALRRLRCRCGSEATEIWICSECAGAYARLLERQPEDLSCEACSAPSDIERCAGMLKEGRAQ